MPQHGTVLGILSKLYSTCRNLADPSAVIRTVAQSAASLWQGFLVVKQDFLQRLTTETEQLRTQGLFKPERVLSSPQSSSVRVAGGEEVLNLCANNYLGLANHASV